MCKVHDKVFGSVAVEALVVARDNGNVCNKRMKYLETQVRSFRDWMMDQNEISKEEANKRLVSMSNRIRKELAEETFDKFTWAGEELRMDNLTDLNKNSDTTEERWNAEHKKFNSAFGIAANVAWKASKQVWMERSHDLKELGHEWLQPIDDKHTGVVMDSDCIRIKNFQKRIHALKNKTKELMYYDWAYLMNYSNNLLGRKRQYTCPEQGITKEEAAATRPPTAKELAYEFATKEAAGEDLTEVTEKIKSFMEYIREEKPYLQTQYPVRQYMVDVVKLARQDVKANIQPVLNKNEIHNSPDTIEEKPCLLDSIEEEFIALCEIEGKEAHTQAEDMMIEILSQQEEELSV